MFSFLGSGNWITGILASRRSLPHLLSPHAMPLPTRRCKQRLYGNGGKAGTGTAATVIDYTQVEERAASEGDGRILLGGASAASATRCSRLLH